MKKSRTSSTTPQIVRLFRVDGKNKSKAQEREREEERQRAQPRERERTYLTFNCRFDRNTRPRDLLRICLTICSALGKSN